MDAELEVSALAEHRATTLTRIGHGALRWSREAANTPAISEAGRHWTYGQLGNAIAEAASLLRDLGVASGDRVMLIGENSMALAALILAAGELDVCAVLENARRAPREVDLIRSHCEPRRVLYTVGASAAAMAHAQRHGAVSRMLPMLGELAFSAEAAPCMADPVAGDASDVAVLIYTTGTTGNPKGVMLTHANLLYLACMMKRLRYLTPHDRVYGVLPITHVMGLVAAFGATLSAGAHLELVARFSAADCVRALTCDGITVMQGAPAMFAKLVQFALEHPFRAPTLRFIAAGGAPIDPTVKEGTEALFGQTLHNGYGLTEGSGLCWTRLDEANADCAVGRPPPGVELKLRDASGQEVASGQVGELWARGPNVMKGYYRNPEQTTQVMRPGGWFNTQDLARQSPDGRFFIEGRIKELIISSGFNVYPLEVETALNAHPAIVQSAVVGRVAEGTEEVIAFVELVEGQSLSLRDIHHFLADRISPYKRPREFFAMAALPSSPNGKILKTQLKDIAQRGLAAAGVDDGSVAVIT